MSSEYNMNSKYRINNKNSQYRINNNKNSQYGINNKYSELKNSYRMRWRS